MTKITEKFIRHSFAGGRIPFQLKSSALLVIDMQNFFLDKKSHAYLPLAKPIVFKIAKLLDFYRRHNLPAIFTRHALRQGEKAGIMDKWWRDNIKDGTESALIISALAHRKNETVIRKTRYNAFCRTKLNKILQKLKVKSVVITGIKTHLCCETTAREAFTRDYQVFFVSDATATNNKELQLSSLRTLADGFAVLATTKEILCSTLQP